MALAAAARARIPISSQRGSTCVPDTFFTILEFSDATKDRFAHLRSLVTANDVERLRRTHTNLRRITFGKSFRSKKRALSTKNILNIPFLAHLQRSYKRTTAYSGPNAAASLARAGPLVRMPSSDAGEGNLAHNLISSADVGFGAAPTGRGCLETDIETYGRNVLQTFFSPSFEIYLNPVNDPGTIFGMMLTVAFTTGVQHMFGLCFNDGILCLIDNNVGFIHEIHDPDFLNRFIPAYIAAPDKTNIDTIEIYWVPPAERAEPYEDLEYFFYIPATASAPEFTYGIDNRTDPVNYVSTLFLAVPPVAPVAPVAPAGGAGRPMNLSNTRKSRKKSQRRHGSTRRSRRAEISHHSFKRK